eukprot:scaffold77723_cov37-Tisochrysis_lutea.AAC.2
MVFARCSLAAPAFSTWKGISIPGWPRRRDRSRVAESQLSARVVIARRAPSMVSAPGVMSARRE